MKGNCYVWSLTGGTKDDPTMLHPRTKIPGAHKRAALKCLFSPDSWWVHYFYWLHSYGASGWCWCLSQVSDAWRKVEHFYMYLYLIDLLIYLFVPWELSTYNMVCAVSHTCMHCGPDFWGAYVMFIICLEN